MRYLVSEAVVSADSAHGAWLSLGNSFDQSFDHFMEDTNGKVRAHFSEAVGRRVGCRG